MTINIFSIAIGVALAIIGHLVAFLRLRWKAMEARRTDWEKLRRPIYAEALRILYSLERCQFQDHEFGTAITGLKEWLPSKATYMPPQGNIFLFEVMHSGNEFWIVSQNNDSDMTLKVNKVFIDNLQKAKNFFMNNEAIRWLPKD